MNGCDVCRHWQGWEPKLLGHSNRHQGTVHRCSACHTFWQSPGGSYPSVITEADARERLREPQPMSRSQMMAGIEPFVQAAGFVSRPLADRDEISERGTVRWSITGDLGLYAVERPGDGPVAWDMIAVVAQPYLAAQVGAAVRSRRRLDPVRLPTDRAPRGVGVMVRPIDGGYQLIRLKQHVATFASQAEAVGFSHLYQDAPGVDPLVRLRSMYLDE